MDYNGAFWAYDVSEDGEDQYDEHMLPNQCVQEYSLDNFAIFWYADGNEWVIDSNADGCNSDTYQAVGEVVGEPAEVMSETDQGMESNRADDQVNSFTNNLPQSLPMFSGSQWEEFGQYQWTQCSSFNVVDTASPFGWNSTCTFEQGNGSPSYVNFYP